jgi:hypothetical protein
MQAEDRKILDSDFLEKLPLLSVNNELVEVLKGNWEFMPRHYGISRLLLSIDHIHDSKVSINAFIYVQKNWVDKNIEGDVNNSCITLSSSIKDPILGKVFTKIYILKINTETYLLPSTYIDLFHNSSKNHSCLDKPYFYKYNTRQ